MPLTRGTVTAASRIMLPTYVIFFAWVGGNWALTDSHRLGESPALRYAATLLPMPMWGCLLVAVSILIAVALLSHRRDLCRFALWIAAIALGLFAVIFALAGFVSVASPSAAAWPLLGAAACIASERSLLKGEVQ